MKSRDNPLLLLHILRWLLIVLQAVVVLFSGWEAGRCWARRYWFGLVVWLFCFCLSANGLRKSLTD